MVQVQAERLRIELVNETRAGRDLLEDPVHVRGVDAMEMNGVRVTARIREVDAYPVALGATDRRTRDLAIVRPGREEDARRHFDLPIDRDHAVLAQGLSRRENG